MPATREMDEQLKQLFEAVNTMKNDVLAIISTTQEEMNICQEEMMKKTKEEMKEAINAG